MWGRSVPFRTCAGGVFFAGDFLAVLVDLAAAALFLGALFFVAAVPFFVAAVLFFAAVVLFFVVAVLFFFAEDVLAAGEAVLLFDVDFAPVDLPAAVFFVDGFFAEVVVEEAGFFEVVFLGLAAFTSLSADDFSSPIIFS